MRSSRINEITVTPIPAFYRKEVGKNAFRDNIGKSCLEWLVRARTDSGFEGLTIANRYMHEFSDFCNSGGTVRGLLDVLSEVFLGKHTDEFLEVSSGYVKGVKPPVREAFRDHGWMSILAFDLLGREMGLSCVDLLTGRQRERIDAYDTTLYFQDFLGVEDGPAQIAAEAEESFRSGYRQFKIKTGRGGRWMLPEEGMRRDVDVVLAVREAVGREARLMVDANFGYDGHLDLLEDFVRETLPADLRWLEEMISAGVSGYRALRKIQDKTGSKSWVVCGEVDRAPISPVFQDLVFEGLIDGYQPDIVGAGFSKWLEIESRLEKTAVRSIPHNFGNGNFGTRAGIIFGAASASFVTLEDEMCLPNTYRTDNCTFGNGSYSLPDTPGLGLQIDEEKYQRVYAKHEARVHQ